MAANRYNAATKTLRVSGSVLNELDALMSGPNPQKIKAIKLLRTETKCGLREAKQAVEKRFQSSYSHPPSPDAFDIRPLVSVKSITVNLGEGEVTLSIDDLHMMTLVNMNQIGIEETRRLLDLHDLICGWEGIKNEREDAD